tara:strand:- start:64 stop:192 length:129 start_codon:yes stop_codon:yes gene_type:complete
MNNNPEILLNELKGENHTFLIIILDNLGYLCIIKKMIIIKVF